MFRIPIIINSSDIYRYDDKNDVIKCASVLSISNNMYDFKLCVCYFALYECCFCFLAYFFFIVFASIVDVRYNLQFVLFAAYTLRIYDKFGVFSFSENWKWQRFTINFNNKKQRRRRRRMTNNEWKNKREKEIEFLVYFSSS